MTFFAHSPATLRACALGQSNQIPQPMALKMWALSGARSVTEDLMELYLDESKRSSVRHLALSLLPDPSKQAVTAAVLRQLGKEQHPRMILAGIQFLQAHGGLRECEALPSLMLARTWPGSCLRPMRQAIRILRHRHGISQEAMLDQQRVTAPHDHWVHTAFPVMPAAGKAFQKAMKVAREWIPTSQLSDEIALTFPCQGEQMMVLIHPALNRFATDPTLFQQPAIAGLILRQTEEQIRPYAWMLSTPGDTGQFNLDIRHVDGRMLYGGLASQEGDLLHLQLTTAEGARVSVVSAGIWFRQNQVLRDSYLKRAVEPSAMPESITWPLSA